MILSQQKGAMDEMQNPSDPADQLEPGSGPIELQDDLEGDTLREECGVFGIFGHPEAAAITALVPRSLESNARIGLRSIRSRTSPDSWSSCACRYAASSSR